MKEKNDFNKSNTEKEERNLNSFSEEIEGSLSDEGWLVVDYAENEQNLQENGIAPDTEKLDSTYIPVVSFDDGSKEKAADAFLFGPDSGKKSKPEFKTSVEDKSFWEEKTQEEIPLRNEKDEELEATQQELKAAQEELKRMQEEMQKIQEGMSEIQNQTETGITEPVTEKIEELPEKTEKEETFREIEKNVEETQPEILSEEPIEEVTEEKPFEEEESSALNLEEVTLSEKSVPVIQGAEDDDFYHHFGDMKLSGNEVPKDEIKDTFYVNYKRSSEKKRRHHKHGHHSKKKKTAEEKRKDAIVNAVSWVLTIVLAFVIALTVNIFVIRPSEVSGDSMKPNLQNGDTVLLSRIPYMLEEPERGDVVVIDSRIPKEDEPHRTVWTLYEEALKHNIVTKLYGVSDPDYFWIKRVIGVPGDEISFEDNNVYRNGEKLNETYINEQEITSYPNGTTINVPEGYYYVLGDNRNHSSDSRVLGIIPEENIIGKMIRKW